jgi:hypothetical protein
MDRRDDELDEQDRFRTDLTAHLRRGTAGRPAVRPTWASVIGVAERRAAQRRAAALATSVVVALLLLAAVAAGATLDRGPDVPSAGVEAGTATTNATNSSTSSTDETPGPGGGPAGSSFSSPPPSPPAGDIETCDDLAKARDHPTIPAPSTFNTLPISSEPALRNADDDARAQYAADPSGGSAPRMVVAGTNNVARVLYQVPDGQSGSVAGPQRVGDWVYFFEHERNGPPDAIRRVPFAGGAPEDVLRESDATSFSVSPDGQQVARLAVSYGPPYESAIVITDLSNGHEQRIAGQQANGDGVKVGQVIWDPDNRHVYVTLATPITITDCRTGQTLPAPPSSVADRPYTLFSDPRPYVVRLDTQGGSLDDATKLTDGQEIAAFPFQGREVLGVDVTHYPTQGGTFTPAPAAIVDAETGAVLPYVGLQENYLSTTYDFRNGDGLYRIVPR